MTQSGAFLWLFYAAEVQLETVIYCLLGIIYLFFSQSVHFSYNNLHLLSYSAQLSWNKSQLKDPSVQKTF